MAGVLPAPRFMRETIEALTARNPTGHPQLRHYTMAFRAPPWRGGQGGRAHRGYAVIGSSVRGGTARGGALHAAYIEGRDGLSTMLDKDMIRATNFSPSRSCPSPTSTAPRTSRVSHDVVSHGNAGGGGPRPPRRRQSRATSTCYPTCSNSWQAPQDRPLPHVTPGSQITWNTASWPSPERTSVEASGSAQGL
jgi:hypothetical protein